MASISSIRIEGGLLGPDILDQLLSGDLPGQRPADFGLEARRNLTDEIAAVFADSRALWGVFQNRLARLGSEDPATTVTRDAWVIPFLGLMGYEPRYNAKAYEVDGLSFAISHRAGEDAESPPIHIVGAGQELGRVPASGRPRMAPHSLLQEYLNRTEQLWGLVTNGKTLRLLRDCSFVRRQAYVEFDLPAILEEQRFQDFTALYRLLHRSRLPRKPADSECFIERYYNLSIEQGGRVREHLRDGVEECIRLLANGFLRHPANTDLQQRVSPSYSDGDRINADGLYRQLLTLVYRFLFLLVSEDRGLLSSNPLYHQHYGISRLRRLLDQRAAYSDDDDLWQSLRVLWQVLVKDTPQPSLNNQPMASVLGLPVLNGDLFAPQALDGCSISNSDLLQAVWQLAWYTDKNTHVSRRVNYGALDVEELGSVYESLLELHPFLEGEPPRRWRFDFAKGGGRKESGSYYTPPQLVNELIVSALEPVIADRLAANPENRQQALLSIRVCDPACGSGHFLLAAARRIARELARVRTGEEEPAPERVREAVRDVMSHCIYGVDKNPLAVDLCRVALWLESHTASKPLTFLDHRIRCGDSLAGVFKLDCLKDGIPDAAFDPLEGDDTAIARSQKVENRTERLDMNRGQRSFAFNSAQALGEWSRHNNELEAISDDSAEAIRRKKQLFERGHADPIWQRQKLACDLWISAFFRQRKPGRPAITTAVLCDQLAGRSIDARVLGDAMAMSVRDRFFHWPLEFAEVFASGGFDVVLGNPPWEMPEVDDREFFANRARSISAEPSAQKRRAMISGLGTTDPSLYEEWISHLCHHKSARAFFARSGRFPNAASGRLNYYKLFLETAWFAVAPKGRLGMVVPSVLATNAYERPLWHSLVKPGHVASIIDFENKKGLFTGIHRGTKFSLVTLTNTPQQRFLTGCWLHDVDDARNPERIMSLGIEDLSRFSPDELALPQFRCRRDLDLLTKATDLLGRLGDQEDWRYTPRLMFSSSDSVFQPADQATIAASQLTQQNRRLTVAGTVLVPVYEGKMVGILDHRQADIYLNPNNAARQAQERAIPETEKADPYRFAVPQFWLKEEDVRQRRFSDTQGDWELVFCDVTSATNERTALACIIPLSGLTRNLPAIYLQSCSAKDAALLAGIFSSFALDYFARLKVSTNHLTQGILSTLPVPSRDRIRQYSIKTFGEIGWFERRVLELIYTAWDLQLFAAEIGYSGPPFSFDTNRRWAIQAEVDAACFSLFGFARDEVEYVMQTFSTVARRDLQIDGEYRTLKAILAVYDGISQCIQAGNVYNSQLSPPLPDVRLG